MRLLKPLIVIAVCLSLSVVAFAHSGRTDSNGGHMNHSTGEYHYHHGRPAHQHTDMDGDGDLDCPYSFDDKTNSSGNKTESSEDITTPQKETKSFWYYVGFGVAACYVVAVVARIICAIIWK